MGKFVQTLCVYVLLLEEVVYLRTAVTGMLLLPGTKELWHEKLIVVMSLQALCAGFETAKQPWHVTLTSCDELASFVRWLRDGETAVACDLPAVMSLQASCTGFETAKQPWHVTLTSCDELASFVHWLRDGETAVACDSYQQ